MTKSFTEAGLSQLGFQYDHNLEIWFGLFEGYPLYINENYQGEYSLNYSLRQSDASPNEEMLRALETHGSQSIDLATADGYLLTLLVKLDLKETKIVDRLKSVLEDAVDFFKTNAWLSACQETGQIEDLAIYAFDKKVAILSLEAYERQKEAIQVKENRPERFILGSLGSLIGGFIGLSLSIFLAYQGYTIWFTGLTLGFLVLKGYRLLARKFSIKGLVISLFILTGFVFLVNELDYAMFFIRGRNLQVIWQFFSEGRQNVGIADGPYWENFRQLALTTYIAASATAYFLLRTSRRRTRIQQIYQIPDTDK